MERIATDTFSFEDLRRGGFVYVDKTAILKQLADGSVGKQFFIARRVDAVVETPCGIYVFEFKLGGGAIIDRALSVNGSQKGRAVSMKPPFLAEEALAQIKEKGFAEKYLRQGKRVTLVGAAFDAEMRNLSDRCIEVVTES